ncbi:type II toxin-antitoxin system YhaV family toxin [Anabaena aphanizomenioides LEGE 00250]|uniref:Type II toxin-antitoxin system YhaV family toxin n=1 Tax=Sphaerospermopsis aphanizomenoides LEGE 00250 TaxID=2777972 RepID=A0ABR9VCJ2_9CYAN|nr:type II toxin-antitoxin system YhaV family toxin [Sphaerospermopsis aphanizomenoides]MBE9236173.1 type II toxin-antitoxin system YhaV family toxin [Sphaerospermopsis aphanizomenoides LEGE 00250]
MSENQPLIINGWTIFAHPLFLEQLEALITQVENLRQKYPQEYKQKNATKRLAAIFKLAFNVIPQDPTLSDYRQGTTLGDEYKHWFRAKFFQQYRLFFRYHEQGKIIVYAWVNDENTKRAYQSKTDAYRVFQKMLESGKPSVNVVCSQSPSHRSTTSKQCTIKE